MDKIEPSHNNNDDNKTNSMHAHTSGVIFSSCFLLPSVTAWLSKPTSPHVLDTIKGKGTHLYISKRVACAVLQ